MFNAVQMIDRLRHEIREIGVAASWTNRRLVDLLNEGHIEVARESYCVLRTVLFQAITGVPVYPLARYCKDFLALHRADWRDVTLGKFSDLTRWTLGSVAYQDTNDTEIRRIGLEGGNLVLQPPPSVVNYTGSTVTVTKDSVTVTVTAGTPGANSVKKGWIFGVGATPTKWYAIAGVSDSAGTITLQQPYREETTAGLASVQSSGAVRLKYASLPDPVRMLSDGGTLRHYYAQGTAAFVVDTDTCLGTAPASWGLEIQGRIGDIGGGMEIGQGTAAAPPADHKWARVRGRISSTSLRLTENWTLESAAAAAYLLCDESPFAPHEERSLAAIYYAAKVAFEGVSGKDAEIQRLAAQYAQTLKRVKGDVGSELGNIVVPVQRVGVPVHHFFGGSYGGSRTGRGQ